MSGRRRDDPDGFDGLGLRNSPPSRNGPWFARWGLLGVVVLALVGVLTGLVPSALTDTQERVREVQKSVQENGKRLEELREDLNRRVEDQTKILRQICVNQAKSDWERRQCLQ